MRYIIVIILAALHIFANAQSPASVPGTGSWFVTKQLYANIDTLYTLEDFSGDNNQFTSRSTSSHLIQQSNKMHSFNFNPAIHVLNDTLASSLNNFNHTCTTIFGVFALDSLIKNENTSFYTITGKSSGPIELTSRYVKDSVIKQLNHGYLLDSDSPFSHSGLRIITYQRAQTPAHSPWGIGKNTNIILSSDNCENSTGYYCPELIAYSRVLSQLERRKVESYLAMKYGITLWGSYFTKDNTMIWDIDNNAYHHRVAAIARDDSSMLFQPMSTTSYEEVMPTILHNNDSFYKHGFFNKSSDKRLLVLGREYASPMPDNSYMIWGDNNLGVMLQEDDTSSLWHTMPRTWLLKSNILENNEDSVSIVRDNVNIFSVNNELYEIRRVESDTNSYASFGPSTSNDLHFGFTCPMEYPTFELGIELSNSNKVEFGYRFGSNGTLSTIQNQISNNIIATNIGGHKIDVYKKGDNLFLQIDGKGCYAYNLEVPISVEEVVVDTASVDINRGRTSEINGGSGHILPEIGPSIDLIPIINKGYSCYGILRIEPGSEFICSDFRIGGFHNTGNQIELSYDTNFAKALKPYRKNRAVLLIDKNENINIYSATKIPNKGFDSERKKLYFHNVYFKDDTNNYFSFATYDGLLADFTPYRASCTNGYSVSNGRLRIDIKCGSPLYFCKMIPIAHAANDFGDLSDDIISGEDILPDYIRGKIFGGENFFMEGLSEGEYSLSLKQLGGTNVYASKYATNSQRYYAEKIFQTSNITYSWYVTDSISKYKAGFTADNDTQISTNIGFEINGRECYIQSGSNRQIISDHLLPGDSLTLIKERNTYRFSINNDTTIVLTNNDSTTRFAIVFDASEATLANIKGINNTSGEDIESDERYISDESIIIEKVMPYEIYRTVFIGSECDPDSPNEVVDEDPHPAPQRFPNRVYYPQQSSGIEETILHSGELIVRQIGNGDFVAELTTDDTGVPELLVFDSLGRMINDNNMIFNGNSYYSSFTLQDSGVYIVKALTDHREFSQKILNR